MKLKTKMTLFMGVVFAMFIAANSVSLISMQKVVAAATKEEIVELTKQSMVTSVVLVVAATITGIILMAWLMRSISTKLEKAIRAAQTVASGNLVSEINVESSDEIGQLMQALQDMNNSLQNVIWHVRQGMESFSNATSEIASGNQSLSSRTEQQASSLEETASSMEELTSTVRQNADNSAQANEMAASASGVAIESGKVVSEVVSTMHEIHTSSKLIADIINVIDGIAFQTNILALNAAVEAARAGEQGRGFAVVATEVRSLAQRSADAAREIKTLINDSVNKVEIGNRLADQAGETMGEVVKSVKTRQQHHGGNNGGQS